MERPRSLRSLLPGGELQNARKALTPLRHVSQRSPEMTPGDCDAIQHAWFALELADNRTIDGGPLGSVAFRFV